MGYIYFRKEGDPVRSGLNLMWDNVSRGVVFRIGNRALWVRYSMRAKKVFVRLIVANDGAGYKNHPAFNRKSNLNIVKVTISDSNGNKDL